MSLVTINGTPVLSGTLTRPLRGAWVAEFALDAAEAPTGTVTLAAGTLSLVGTVVLGGSFHDRPRVRVVGGFGGFGVVAAPRFFRNVQLGLLLRETCAAGGETLSASSDASVTSRSVDAWSRARGPVGAALNTIVSRVDGTAWRVLPDGSTWVGTPTWPTAMVDYVLISSDDEDGRQEIALDSYDLDAGSVLDGRRLRRVQYTFEADAVRAVIWS